MRDFMTMRRSESVRKSWFAAFVVVVCLGVLTSCVEAPSSGVDRVPSPSTSSRTVRAQRPRSPAVTSAPDSGAASELDKADLLRILPPASSIGPGYSAMLVTDDTNSSDSGSSLDDQELNKQCPALARFWASSKGSNPTTVEQDYTPSNGSMLTVQLAVGQLEGNVETEAQLRELQRASNTCGELTDVQHPSPGVTAHATSTITMRVDDTYGDFGALMMTTMALHSEGNGMTFGLDGSTRSQIFRVGHVWATVSATTNAGPPKPSDDPTGAEALSRLATLLESRMEHAKHQ